ncbi:MAG: FAD-dependent monooxygenase, partial [Acidobacteria bacterium]|nr:FAD-dependent monooxygenase [Acidobacteriota bacterium]
MLDVIVVGGGPAGSIAALVLARAGARVRLIDRATFPRDKLCGDTVNPGTMAALRRLGVSREIEDRGLEINGMLVTGASGITVEGRYPRGLHGRALIRRDLDWILLQHALAAGVQFESGLAVRAAIVEEAEGRPAVRGVFTSGGNRAGGCEQRARVTIAADGRRSTLAFGLG